MIYARGPKPDRKHGGHNSWVIVSRKDADRHYHVAQWRGADDAVKSRALGWVRHGIPESSDYDTRLHEAEAEAAIAWRERKQKTARLLFS